MRVLVTGGAGFIGAWAIRRLLAQGIDVRVLDAGESRQVLHEIVGPRAERLDMLRGDVSRNEDVSGAAVGCDMILHLAGVLTPFCQRDPVRGAQINLIGTLNVFEAAKQHRLRGVVFTSSAGVFGPVQGRYPEPTTHYGAFKLATEASARAYWQDDGIPSVALRPLVVYGPGREVGASAGPTLACRAAARGEAYTMPMSGRAGLVYVDDVAAAMERALLNLPRAATVYNLIGESVDMTEVVARIQALVPGAQIGIDGAPLPIAPDVGPDHLAEALGAASPTTVAEGLRRTVAHYRAQ